MGLSSRTLDSVTKLAGDTTGCFIKPMILPPDLQTPIIHHALSITVLRRAKRKKGATCSCDKHTLPVDDTLALPSWTGVDDRHLEE